MADSDVRIGEVAIDLEVTEGIGPLGPDEVRALVILVLDQVRKEQARDADRRRDTTIHDRAYRPVVG